MNTLSPDSRAVRVTDQLLDLLLCGILLGAPLIFYTKGHDVFEFNKLTVVHVLSCLAAVLLLAKLLYVRPLALQRHALDLPVFAWLLICLVATFNTVSWRLSVHGVYEDFEGITTWLNYIFLFYWAGQHIRSERQIRLVLGTVALAGTAMGFYGLLQNFGIDFVPWNPDTYSKTRMFSTMGNPNFLAAYCVMSMPITFALFMDVPERIRTNQSFCAVLIILGAVASVGLCTLFNTSYFNFDPAFYDAPSFGRMLISQKFIVTKVLLAFPLIAAVMMYFGRLSWVLLLSLLFQLVSTLFTKSRGGIISIAMVAVLFVGVMAWDWGKGKAFLYLSVLAAVVAGVIVSGLWEHLFNAAFVDYRFVSLLLFAGALYGGLRWLKGKQLPGSVGLLQSKLNYVVALVALVWLAHYNESIRSTTFEMIQRTAQLTNSHEVQYTPRLFIWRSALAMLRDHFFFGMGLDTFQIAFPPYRLILYWILEWNGTPEKAHNFFMQTAATMGFTGLIVFVWIFVTFTWRTMVDWMAQKDERRRLLIMATFGGVLAFAAQNLFSFTVVGYGSLWWILMGFLPAMARTWEAEDAGVDILPSPALAPTEAPSWWLSPSLAWKAGLGLLSATLIVFAVAGPTFFGTDTVLALRWALGLLGASSLGLILFTAVPQRPGAAANTLWLVCALGGLFFSWYSVRIWVADSFYKQGQVGVSVNQIGYAAAMYQKAAGRLVDVTNEQLNSIHLAETPTSQADYLKITPGLNPDQELYWVKMGIAFESAAAAVPPGDPKDPAQVQQAKDTKLTYFRTALAIHQHTLEMNPINGYNFNNKGRVLKSMGEAFGEPGYYLRALEHYDRAIALDENNAYFNLDKANTLLNLGRTGEAFDLCQKMSEKFTDFAVPRSYQGFIKMRAGDRKAAIKYFSEAVKLDWKRDIGSRALAATNLGILESQEGHDAEAVAAFNTAIESNPGFPDAYINLANQHVAKHRLNEAYAVLAAGAKAAPGDARITQMLSRFTKK